MNKCKTKIWIIFIFNAIDFSHRFQLIYRLFCIIIILVSLVAYETVSRWCGDFMKDYDPKLLPERVNEFLHHILVVKNASELTVNGYARDLRLLFEYIVAERRSISPGELGVNFDLSFIDDKFLSEITLKDIYSFLTYCAQERGNNPTTRKRKASSIRSFYKYISDNMKYVPSNPVSQLQIMAEKKRLPRYLTLEQSIDLLNAVDGPNKARDYCIITLFLNCGLRLAELVGLNLGDINFDERTITVIGKGSKQRRLYLNDACVDALKSYLAVRPVDGLKGDARNALFVSRLKKRIGRQAVQLMVYRNLEKIGLDGQHYSVHKLRHTAATLLYQHSGVDVLVLKEMLGHENLSTTEIYTHVDDKRLRAAIESNPLNNNASKN